MLPGSVHVRVSRRASGDRAADTIEGKSGISIRIGSMGLSHSIVCKILNSKARPADKSDGKNGVARFPEMHIRPGKSVCSRLYRAFAHTARLASSSGAMTSTSIASSWAALAVMGSFDPIMATTRCASSASVVLWVLEAMSARRGYSLLTRSACRLRAFVFRVEAISTCHYPTYLA